MSALGKLIFERIKHGDDEHQAWLRAKSDEIAAEYEPSMAEPVEIVDQPEAYAKMREAAGLCSDCGGDHHAHYGSCPRISAAFAQQRVPRYDGPVPGQTPQPTAYERDQQALRDRVAALEERANRDADKHNRLCDCCADYLSRIKQLEASDLGPRCAACRENHTTLAQHLDDAVQRIEQLKLEVASRIKQLEASDLGPRCAACRENHTTLAQHLDDAVQRIEQLKLEVARLKGPQSPYVQAIDQKLENIRQSASSILGGELPTHLGCGCPGPRCNGHQFSASPATAYPPMPEPCGVCGVDPTTREGFAAVAAKTRVIDGKRYCWACAPPLSDEGT
jgi:hypothetical protein